MVQGRIVWVSGDIFKGRQKVDQITKQPRLNAKGEPMLEYGFGLAVPKTSLSNDPAGIWQSIHEEAYTLYPSRQLPPSFAMKYKDGDGIDDQGKPFAARTGYAGHLIFACTTSLPVKFFKNENGQVMMSDDPTLFYPGCYVQVQLQVKAHPAHGQGKPGLYLNPNAALFLGHGERIINAPSGEQIFGTSMPALPPGASPTPIAIPGMMVAPQGAPQQFAPQAPTFAQPGYPQQQAPTPQYAPPPQQGGPAAFAPSMGQPSVAAQPVQPHYGVLPAAHQPQMPPPQYAPQGAPAMPGVPQMAPPAYAPPQAQQAQPMGYPQQGAPAMPGMPGIPR